MALAKDGHPSRSSGRSGRPGPLLLDSSASRPASPPQYYSQDIALSEDSDVTEELLHSGRPRRNPGWWAASHGTGRRSGPASKFTRRITRHPLFPTRPITIVSYCPLHLACIHLIILFSPSSSASSYLRSLASHSASISNGTWIQTRSVCHGAHTALYPPFNRSALVQAMSSPFTLKSRQGNLYPHFRHLTWKNYHQWVSMLG